MNNEQIQALIDNKECLLLNRFKFNSSVQYQVNFLPPPPDLKEFNKSKALIDATKVDPKAPNTLYCSIIDAIADAIQLARSRGFGDDFPIVFRSEFGMNSVYPLGTIERDIPFARKDFSN